MSANKKSNKTKLDKYIQTMLMDLLNHMDEELKKPVPPWK